MTLSDLVSKLEANNYRTDAIARIIGYTVLIQRTGWDALKLTRQSKAALRKTYRSIGIEPEAIIF